MFDYNYPEKKSRSALEVHQYAREMKKYQRLSAYEDHGENIRSSSLQTGLLANLSKKLMIIIGTPVRLLIAPLGK